MGLTAVEFQNVIDDERFRRNYRIRGYEIHLTPHDAAPTTGSLDDVSRPQRVDLPYTEARSVTVHVTSTYPAEAYNDGPPFAELALAEVTFIGDPGPGGAEAGLRPGQQPTRFGVESTNVP